MMIDAYIKDPEVNCLMLHITCLRCKIYVDYKYASLKTKDGIEINDILKFTKWTY